MNEKVKAFQCEFNEIAEECQMFCFMSRAKEFQVEACKKLDALREKASALKEQMIVLTDEDSANAMLSFEEMIDALVNELKMWIALKEDNPNSAWDFLTNAQSAARTAMQAHEVASHLEGYIERLHALEKFLFPPTLFFSPGIVIKHSKCSICGQEYGECDHVVGRAYMGKMCTRELTDIEVTEVSLVEEPANKRARVLIIKEGGVTRDFLSWRVISDPLSDETDK
jgi:hypothetical protein